MNSIRNAWGNQIDSFSDYISLIDNKLFSEQYYATFIRGPKFFDINNACSVLGYHNSDPVLIRNKKHLLSSFHPEINDDLCAIFKTYGTEDLEDVLYVSLGNDYIQKLKNKKIIKTKDKHIFYETNLITFKRASKACAG